MKLFYYILWLLKGIKVFALVGKSGTGKSFRAKLIAEKYGIELIIDDGLLIRDNGIIAGKSAKKETAYLTAIKTAIFNEKEHRDEVCHELQTQRFNRVLILGTSEKMVKKITKRLKLPHISKMIHIEDIATEEEINNAIKSRHMEGKHIIPVPTIEIQRDYSHIIYDSVKVFVKKKIFNIGKGNEKYYEKTVV
jgi:adenylate kinase family enzyme